ncbi:MAG: Rieske 2Fe-2S domain-containing protein [Prochloraceae cyanobacterium]
MNSKLQTKETLNPGGPDPRTFDPFEAWYPVFYIEDLDRQTPNTFTLLAQDIVIWWSQKTNSWQAFEDKCPHRLAPLSQGRINEAGWLECPYHGWAFSESGNCEVIPQQPEGTKAETSQRACVKSMPTRVCQGLLFVYPGSKEYAEQTPVPIVPAIEENREDWVVANTFRDLPYDAATLLENVIDSSHVPYTHHKSVSNRASVSPVELKIVESGKNGFEGIWEEGPRKGTLGSQYTSFVAPSLMYHDLTAKQFGRTLTVVYATPIRKGECRLFARFPFKFNSKIPSTLIKLTPRWYSHIRNNAILEDDQIFLHYQERYLEAKGGRENFTKAFYLPTKADLYVFEYRNWFNNYQADPFPGQSLPTLSSTEQLLDRYNSHTKKCSSCSQALANIKTIRSIVGIVAVTGWSLSPLLILFSGEDFVYVAIEAIATLLLAGIWYGLGKLELSFTRGREIPPRNLPENN